MVSGKYKSAFSEATHCLFNGHLDDPDFQRVAIQKIVARTADAVTLSRSGLLPIKTKAGNEYVDLTYQGFFGKQRTTGHPFKDDKTELPNAGSNGPSDSEGPR